MGCGVRKRRVAACVLLVAAWLGVGAVLNVAVAWGLAIREARALQMVRVQIAGGGRLSEFYTHSRPAALRWVAPVPKGWPEAPKFSEVCFDFGIDLTVAVTSVGRPSPGDPGRIFMEQWATQEHTYGVPLRSVVRWRRWESRDPLANAAVSATSPELPAAWLKPVCGATSLPIVPLWPGFALNTIFYALLAWGAWQVPLALRRRSRRRAGRCAACGYSLAGLTPGSPCPECGTAQRPMR